MEKDELLAKTQMALGLTNPIKTKFIEGKGYFSNCIHCGHKHNPEKAITKNHNEDCIYLIAVLAVGDYE